METSPTQLDATTPLSPKIIAFGDTIHRAIELRMRLIKSAYPNDSFLPWLDSENPGLLTSEADFSRFIERGSEADKSNALFPAVTARRGAEALAVRLYRELELTKADISALRRMHEFAEDRWTSVVSRLNPKAQLAVVVAVFALILQQTPEQVVIKLGFDYDSFRIAIFLVLVFSLGMVALLWYISRETWRLMKRETELRKLVLVHCENIADAELGSGNDIKHGRQSTVLFGEEKGMKPLKN